MSRDQHMSTPLRNGDARLSTEDDLASLFSEVSLEKSRFCAFAHRRSESSFYNPYFFAFQTSTAGGYVSFLTVRHLPTGTRSYFGSQPKRCKRKTTFLWR